MISNQGNKMNKHAITHILKLISTGDITMSRGAEIAGMSIVDMRTMYQLYTAMHDAIHAPKGIVPGSARQFYDPGFKELVIR